MPTFLTAVAVYKMWLQRQGRDSPAHTPTPCQLETLLVENHAISFTTQALPDCVSHQDIIILLILPYIT